jgi:hypothetical protein
MSRYLLTGRSRRHLCPWFVTAFQIKEMDMTGGKVRPGEDGTLPNDAARDLGQGKQNGSATPAAHEKPSKPPLGSKDDAGSDSAAAQTAASTQ